MASDSLSVVADRGYFKGEEILACHNADIIAYVPIRANKMLEQNMVTVPIGTEIRMAVVASPEYINLHGVPKVPADLMGHACIRYNSVVTGTHERWTFSCEGQHVEIETIGRISSNDG